MSVLPEGVAVPLARTGMSVLPGEVIFSVNNQKGEPKMKASKFVKVIAGVVMSVGEVG